MDEKCRAVLKMIRISPQKLNLIAAPLRKKSVSDAIRILEGMRKAAAVDVKKLVKSALANAVHNFGFQEDKLLISQITVGKNLVMKRRHIGGRSHSGEIRKPFSQITVWLKEV